jgi:hypothetical protein
MDKVSHALSSSGRPRGTRSVMHSPHQPGLEGQGQPCTILISRQAVRDKVSHARPPVIIQAMRDNRNCELSICITFLRNNKKRFNCFVWGIILKRVWFLWKKNCKKDGLFALIDLMQKDQFLIKLLLLFQSLAANTSAKRKCFQHPPSVCTPYRESCKRALNGKPAFDPTWISNCNNILPHNFSIENPHVNKVLSSR